MFAQTNGTHPIFNPLDANNPETDLSTVEARRAGYSMMLTRGVFRRGGAPRADREWDIVAVDDPHGFANVSRIVQWRRVMPTINFHLGSATVNWDGGNTVGTDQLAGLANQATRNVAGAQQGAPAPAQVIADIVDFETTLSTAQAISFTAGPLNARGARGGAEEPRAWSGPRDDSTCSTRGLSRGCPGRAQIARGQELFNNPNPGGRMCNACHNSVNNGTNYQQPAVRHSHGVSRGADAGSAALHDPQPDDRRRAAAERHRPRQRHRSVERSRPLQDADAARASPRGRPTSTTASPRRLDDVVRHYETHLGFVFTDQERADLVAFLKAL